MNPDTYITIDGEELMYASRLSNDPVPTPMELWYIWHEVSYLYERKHGAGKGHEVVGMLAVRDALLASLKGTLTIDTDNVHQVSRAAMVLEPLGYEFHRSDIGETVFTVEGAQR